MRLLDWRQRQSRAPGHRGDEERGVGQRQARHGGSSDAHHVSRAGPGSSRRAKAGQGSSDGWSETHRRLRRTFRRLAAACDSWIPGQQVRYAQLEEKRTTYITTARLALCKRCRPLNTCGFTLATASTANITSHAAESIAAAYRAEGRDRCQRD